MAIPIDIYGLEKLDEITDEVVLVDLVLGGVQTFHEVDESGQFKTFGIEFELSLEDFHVLM